MRKLVLNYILIFLLVVEIFQAFSGNSIKFLTLLQFFQEANLVLGIRVPNLLENSLQKFSTVSDTHLLY